MIKKAIISRNEIREAGYRVAQVENTVTHPVGEPNHFWVDCPDYVVADRYWFDPSDNSFKEIIFPSIDP